MPEHTAPAGYGCPTCSVPIIPAENAASPVAVAVRASLRNAPWARRFLGGGSSTASAASAVRLQPPWVRTRPGHRVLMRPCQCVSPFRSLRRPPTCPSPRRLRQPRRRRPARRRPQHPPQRARPSRPVRSTHTETKRQLQGPLTHVCMTTVCAQAAAFRRPCRRARSRACPRATATERMTTRTSTASAAACPCACFGVHSGTWGANRPRLAGNGRERRLRLPYPALPVRLLYPGSTT